ncbi:MAG: glycosyltransferase [Hyphomicrobiaceae bacterium]
MAASIRTVERAFDGIICMGGQDWWYHNRGHFDLQILRRLARHMPVLFVNSIGVRMPSASDPALFAARIRRKLKSLARGLVEAEPGFFVFSPLVVPGSIGARLSHWALAPQIRFAARRAGIARPLVWMHCPAGAALIGRLGEAALVLERTDLFEAYPEGDPALIGAQIGALKAAADLVVYCNAGLAGDEQHEVRRAVVVDHGVDLARFAAAGDGKTPIPADLAGIRGARVGFVGGIDAHTFDPDLFRAVAIKLPQVQFVLVGACSLPDGWCRLPNVHLLGRKPYEEVAAYMAAMDCLIMPWNRSDWIRGCNPIKLKEYLAVGRPVVSTDFPALAPWRDLVTVATDAEHFASAIERALVTRFPVQAARRRLLTETWDHKATEVLAAIAGLGCAPQSAIRPDVPPVRATPAQSAA